MNQKKYQILCKSEILGGKFAPTAHPSFDTWHEANSYAEKNIKETEFKVGVIQ